MEQAVSDANLLRLSVTGWGAPLILFLINSLILPLLIWWAANSIKFWQQSRIDTFILDGNVVFLTLNTVIFPTVGNGSIGALIGRFYDMEVQQWNVSLGLLIASQSGSFALRYLLNACFITPGCALLQIGQITWHAIFRCFGKTCEPSEFDFAYNYAFALAMCFMVTVFGTVLPFVFPLGCLFFGMKYAVDKYNLTCGVLKARSDSGGAVAFIATRYMLASVGFMQFILSGYFIAHGLNLFAGNGNIFDKKESSDDVKRILHGRFLILGGTCFLLISALTAVLLLGHSLFQLRSEKNRIGVTANEADRILLIDAYAHPCEALSHTQSP